MSVYAVLLEHPDEGAQRALEEKWPNRTFIVDDRLILVSPEESVTTTAEIATVAGIGSEAGGRIGLVFEISGRAGFHRSDLWEWLRKVEK